MFCTSPQIQIFPLLYCKVVGGTPKTSSTLGALVVLYPWVVGYLCLFAASHVVTEFRGVCVYTHLMLGIALFFFCSGLCPQVLKGSASCCWLQGPGIFVSQTGSPSWVPEIPQIKGSELSS